MSETENGGALSADDINGGENTNDMPNGGDNSDIQKQIEEMQSQIDLLKKESSGKDRKIAEFKKEKENIELANKTAAEQLEYYKKQIELHERQEAFRQSFKDLGLNSDEFQSIVDEKDPKTQAEKFAKLLKAHKEKSAAKAIEEYKLKELEKTGEVPKPKKNNEIENKEDKYYKDLLEAALG